MAKRGARWCSAPNCRNNSKTLQEEKLCFFGFPKCAERCRKWVQNCRREDFLNKNSDYLHKNCVLCSEHFEPCMFLNFERTRLFDWAVPTLFNVPNPPQKYSLKRKLPSRHNESSLPHKTEKKNKMLNSAPQSFQESLTESVSFSTSAPHLPCSKEQNPEEVLGTPGPSNFSLCLPHLPSTDIFNTEEFLSTPIKSIPQSPLESIDTISTCISHSPTIEEFTAEEVLSIQGTPNFLYIPVTIENVDPDPEFSSSLLHSEMHDMHDAHDQNSKVPHTVEIPLTEEEFNLLNPLKIPGVEEKFNFLDKNPSPLNPLPSFEASPPTSNKVRNALENLHNKESSLSVSNSVLVEAEQPAVISIGASSKCDFSCQTEKCLSSHTPRKLKLRKKNVFLNRKVRSSKAKLSKRFPVDKRPKSIQEKLKLFQELCDELLPDEFKDIVKINAQLYLKKNAKGRRYPLSFKKFALTLYYMSPKAYRYARSIFLLPTPRSLRNLTKNWKFNPGFNENIMSVLKAKVSNLPPEKRICTLCADELSLKANLFYNASEDSIIGLHDLGTGKSFRVATHALVFMAAGILDNWKQPIAFFLVNSTCSAFDLKSLLLESIKKLTTIGLTVKCVISDMGSNFIQVSKLLCVTNIDPFFTVEEKKIYYIFDPPHLIKSLRNNLMKYTFVSNNKQASWKDISFFYEKTKNIPTRCASKITDLHVYPNGFQRMKVKYATQIFSATLAASICTFVGIGYMSAKASGTADLLLNMDKLFDLMNSSTFKSNKKFKKPFKGEPYQIDFCYSMLKFFDELKLVDDKGNDVTSSVKFINGFKTSIRAILDLSSSLKKEGIDVILTRRLNQDCLENFFSLIRSQGGHSTNPTPVQFCRAFKKLFCMNFFQKSMGSNCHEDFNKVLSKICDVDLQSLKDFCAPRRFCAENFDSDNELLEAEKNFCEPSSSESSLILKNTALNDLKNMKLPISNVLNYIAGYLIKKCLSRHSCNICQDYSKKNVDSTLDQSTLFCYFKAYETSDQTTFGSLKMPANEFLLLVEELEQTFLNNFGNTVYKPASELFRIFESITFSHPCEKFPLVYLFCLYIRMRIYYAIKDINKNFKNSKKENKKKFLTLNHM